MPTGTLDADGKFTSHITATYRTDDETLLRQVARSVAPAEWDKVSQYLSSNTPAHKIKNAHAIHIPDLCPSITHAAIVPAM